MSAARLYRFGGLLRASLSFGSNLPICTTDGQTRRYARGFGRYDKVKWWSRWLRTLSHIADAAVEGVRARLAPGGGLGQPTNIMGPALRMAAALFRIGQAGMGQAQ